MKIQVMKDVEVPSPCSINGDLYAKISVSDNWLKISADGTSISRASFIKESDISDAKPVDIKSFNSALQFIRSFVCDADVEFDI